MLIQKNQGLLKEIEDKKASYKLTRVRIEKRYNSLSENEQRLLEKSKEEEKRVNEQISIQESKEDEGIAKSFTEFKTKVFFSYKYYRLHERILTA